MKKYFLIQLFACISLLSSGQKNASQNLVKYCDIDFTYLSGFSMTTVLSAASNTDVDTFFIRDLKDLDGRVYLSKLYNSERFFLLESMTNNLWSLISKQLNGEEGKLSTSPWTRVYDLNKKEHKLGPLNLFPTLYKGNEFLIMVMWSYDTKKWLISTISPVELSILAGTKITGDTRVLSHP